MFCVGLDVHQKRSSVCIFNEHGKKVKEFEVLGPWDRLLEELARLPRPMAVCFEASTGRGWLCERIAPKKPNAWGLYDMHGNVWEWRQDKYKTSRVLRGGSWLYGPRRCRSAGNRGAEPGNRRNYFGFSVVLDLSK